jgi:CHAD domain-containing protein
MSAPDRRELLARFADPEDVPPLTPSDAGTTLTWNLLYPKVVETYLPAARPWPKDTEELVHDVRVASRRLVEALELAAPMLRRKARRRAQEQAKTLRRALGAGREHDVMRADLARLASAAGLKKSIVSAAGLTRAGSNSLSDVKAAYRPELLLGRALDVLEMATKPRRPKLNLRQIAGPHLTRRADQTEELIDSVLDPNRLEDQHRLRIRFKRLRYTTEILADPFHDVIDGTATVTLLKDLQDALGDLNDMKDLLLYLQTPKVKSAVGAKAVRKLVAAGEAVLEERGGGATALVVEQAPVLVAELRRAAGVIGPMYCPWRARKRR